MNAILNTVLIMNFIYCSIIAIIFLCSMVDLFFIIQKISITKYNPPRIIKKIGAIPVAYIYLPSLKISIGKIKPISEIITLTVTKKTFKLILCNLLLIFSDP